MWEDLLWSVVGEMAEPLVVFLLLILVLDFLRTMLLYNR